MLKDFEKKKREDKDALNAELKVLRNRLLGQQQLLRDAKLPVIVLIEGWAAAGKGSLIKELISEIDPRFYNTVSPVITPEPDEGFLCENILVNGHISLQCSDICVNKSLTQRIGIAGRCLPYKTGHVIFQRAFSSSLEIDERRRAVAQ